MTSEHIEWLKENGAPDARHVQPGEYMDAYLMLSIAWMVDVLRHKTERDKTAQLKRDGDD